MICSHLNNGVFVDTSSRVTPCCYVRSNNRPEYKEIVTSDLHNHPVLKAIRRDVMNGITPPECVGCKHSKGITRKYSNDGIVTSETVQASDIEYLHVRFNNVCNFNCVMCNPSYSHLIHKETYPNETPYVEMPVDHHAALINDLPSMTGLKQIMLAGGEPFVIKNTVIEFLRQIPIKDVRVVSFTNGSRYDDELLDELETFSLGGLTCSIDGMGDVFNYQRAGGDWDVVYENIKKFSMRSNIKLHWSPTITCLNLMQLPETIDEIDGYFAESWFSNVLCDPEYYHIKMLKPEYLKQVRQHIQDQGLLKEIDLAIDTEVDQSLIEQFWARAEYNLKHRGVDIQKLIPSISEIIREN
jgi:sulfatase maturation enzyme AslB (radical SAM superfamily)